MSSTRPDPTVTPDVTVVVVTWEQRELTLAALDSLAAQTIPHRVLLVDNASTDGVAEAVAIGHPEVEVLRLPTNTGFAGGMAAAIDRVDTRYTALLNNDARADPDWLAASVAVLDAHPDVAAATSKLLLDDGSPTARVNNAGVVLLDSGYGADRGLGEVDDDRFAEPVEVFGFSGGAAVLRTLAVKAVGGFDASLFMYYEDTDLSWRLRLAGWRIVYVPTAVVPHRHAASSDPASVMFARHTERNRLLLLARHAPLVCREPHRPLPAHDRIARREEGHRPGGAAGPRLRPRPAPAVLGEVARLLPDTLRRRSRAAHGDRRAPTVRHWSGRDHDAGEVR